MTMQDGDEDLKKAMWYRLRGRGQPEVDRLRKIEEYRNMPKDGQLELETIAQEWSSEPSSFWNLIDPAVIGRALEGHEHLLLCWRTASGVLCDDA